MKIIVYSNFIRYENYVFLYLVSIVLFAVTLFVVVFWSFSIERNKKKAVLMLVINLFLLNSAQFLFYNIKIDPYSQSTTFINNDPIYEDYKNIIKYIYSKEKIPTTYLYQVGKPLDSLTPIEQRKLHVSIGTIDGINSMSSADHDSSEKYKNDISLNISNLEALDSVIVFRRNRKILAQWHNHFQAIDNIMKDHSTDEYFKENKHTFEHILPGAYVSKQVYSNLIVEVINLEDYHRKIIKHHSNCRDIADLARNIINIPATLVDNLFTDYDKKESPLHYKFEELTDDDYKKYNSR